MLGLDPDRTFQIDDDVLALYRDAGRQGRERREAWQARLDAWDGDRDAYEACMAGTGLTGWDAKLPTWDVGDEVATRKASGSCFNAFADVGQCTCDHAKPVLVVAPYDRAGVPGQRGVALLARATAWVFARQRWGEPMERPRGVGAAVLLALLTAAVQPVPADTKPMLRAVAESGTRRSVNQPRSRHEPQCAAT